MVLFRDSYFRPSSKLDYLIDRVVNFCNREHLTCVDMRPPLQPSYQGEHRLWTSKLDPHPSAFVYRIAADEIFNAFGQTRPHREVPAR